MDDILEFKNKCRVCKGYTDGSNSNYPFDKEECHLVWAAENMPKNQETGKPQFTIEQMQRKLLQMGKEVSKND